MSWSGIAKFFTGFVLAIAVLFFAGVSTTRYLITRFTTPPPRPTFPNEPSAQADAPAESVSPPAEPPIEAVQPSPTLTPSATPTNPPGAYEALVTQPIGLILRQEPTQDSEQIGGIGYEEQVVVLEESSDGEWLKVRTSENNAEGWVKSGNTERLN
jgi:hypothetical protein